MWLSNSSVGRKVVMSVTGIALISDVSHGDEPCCAGFGRRLQHGL